MPGAPVFPASEIERIFRAEYRRAVTALVRVKVKVYFSIAASVAPGGEVSQPGCRDVDLSGTNLFKE